MKKYLLLTVGVIMTLTITCKSEKNPILNIEGGEIQGVKTETKGVYVYKGIPYAAPPVGENRWREPQPVIPWQDIKIADSFGAPAPQGKHSVESFYGKEFFWQGDPEFSEDCLFLNVWTPAPGKKGQKITGSNVDSRRRIYGRLGNGTRNGWRGMGGTWRNSSYN